MSKIPKKCEYCKRGRLAADGETVLCLKKGPVDRNFHCRHYKYDILKREPGKQTLPTDVSSEDLKLE
jgi:molybdenum cofactor biosynthesis enzyme MoaA